jgi:hypothetical protein
MLDPQTAVGEGMPASPPLLLVELPELVPLEPLPLEPLPLEPLPPELLPLLLAEVLPDDVPPEAPASGLVDPPLPPPPHAATTAIPSTMAIRSLMPPSAL